MFHLYSALLNILLIQQHFKKKEILIITDLYSYNIILELVKQPNRLQIIKKGITSLVQNFCLSWTQHVKKLIISHKGLSEGSITV